MMKFFEGFEKEASFLNKGTSKVVDKVLGKAKDLASKIKIPVGMKHTYEVPKGKNIPIRHELDPQAKAWANKHVKELKEKIETSTKHLPLKLLGGSAIVGAGSTLGSKGADKITGG